MDLNTTYYSDITTYAATPTIIYTTTGAPNVTSAAMVASDDSYITPSMSFTTFIAAATSIAPTNASSNITNATLSPSGGQFLSSVITTGKIVEAVIYSILSVCIVFGNLLVIGSFKINRRLRTTTNFFIMSLAIADLSIGTISVPMWTYFVNLLNPMLLGTVYEDEYSFWLAFDVIVGVSSILNLTMISLERCYALKRPLQHRNISKRVVVCCVITAWLLATLAGSLRFMLPNKDLKRRYGVIVAVPFFILPLSIIFCAYGLIFKIARAHARGRGVRSFRKDLRIATTVAVVIGLFALCWTPFFSINLFYSVCYDFIPNVCGQMPEEIFPLIKWMQYVSSACNPVVYGFRNRDFRVAFKRIVYGVFGREVQMPNRFTQSTYVASATNRRRYLRTESSFDDSQSVLYPDQIVPPGMYDMRESYRKAINTSLKTPIKPKPKGVAQGILSINMDALNTPVKSCNGSAARRKPADPKNSSLGVVNTAVEEDKDAIEPNGIEIYPYMETSLGISNSAIEEEDRDPNGINIYPLEDSQVQINGVVSTSSVRVESHVHFDES